MPSIDFLAHVFLGICACCRLILLHLRCDLVRQLPGQRPRELQHGYLFRQSAPHRTGLPSVRHVVVHEELEEEHEVAQVHRQTKHRVRAVHVALLASALVHHRLDRHEHAHEHLQQLRQGDEDGVRGDVLAVWRRRQRKVAIHNRVHGVVHGGEPQARGDAGGVGVPAVQQHRGVVPPLQPDHRLPSQQQQDGVEELCDLGVDEERNEAAGDARSVPSCWRTTREIQAVLHKGAREHRHASEDAAPGEDRQEGIPIEGGGPHIPLAVLGHHPLQRRNQDKVHSDGGQPDLPMATSPTRPPNRIEPVQLGHLGLPRQFHALELRQCVVLLILLKRPFEGQIPIDRRAVGHPLQPRRRRRRHPCRHQLRGRGHRGCGTTTGVKMKMMSGRSCGA
mmetsp:Transcript_102275/g.266789  ORF Transcript_102275/g.266789 Transcript_102275/m.266789 type:complete len:392 (+) Transcript_102275:167-1342(+)